jgi:hypothetical protein
VSVIQRDLKNLGISTDSPGTARQTESTSPKGGQAMSMGKERTKEQLYNQAKRLGVKGRSKMNKGQLKAALSRRGH